CTTLGGEGLQHQDGSSLVMAATVPNCRSYDPAFAGELAVIVDHGMRQMMERDVDEFYYITVMNENYAQPSLPAGVEEQVIRGMYRFSSTEAQAAKGSVRLLGSGTILREVIAAAELLAADWNVSSEVFSVTSFSELAREAREVERHNRLNPSAAEQVSHLSASLAGTAPVIAATDYIRAWPQLIASYVDARFIALGTDGFGRSDTRTALRSFFEVDRHQVVLAALDGLVRDGTLPRSVLAEAVARYGLDGSQPAPWLR
ncbi:MAG: pyruvate dehydrogenase (acetyl-transferring), homodimeric type, partial [Pseudomonas sp.]